MITPQPTGTIGDGPLGREVRNGRTFPVGIDDVWAAMTESERMESWVGRWQGDPSTGSVIFFMTAEGQGAEPEKVTIRERTPPYRFAAETGVGEQTWHLRFELREDSGGTAVVFSQALGSDDLADVGPGWEYYLDRLGATLTGDAVDAIDWETYLATMKQHYARLAAQ